MLTTLLAIMALDPVVIQLDVTPKFQNGTHFGCETSFEIIIQDTAYEGGHPVVVAGSFSLYNFIEPPNVAVGMKLGVSRDGETFMPPSNAYVVNGYKSNLSEQVAQVEAENPQFRMFVYDAGGEETINAIARLGYEQRLDVAYTLRDGAMAMLVPISLSEEQAESWDECVQALLTRDE